MMWEVQARSGPSGIQANISHGDTRLSFREFFYLLENSMEFARWYSGILARLRADPVPFESQFALQRGSDVITFRNLGGDALLVVPAPLGSMESYPHLATFLRKAPAGQVESLWKGAARAIHETLSDTPIWLSTAGLLALMATSWYEASQERADEIEVLQQIKIALESDLEVLIENFRTLQEAEKDVTRILQFLRSEAAYDPAID